MIRSCVISRRMKITMSKFISLLIDRHTLLISTGSLQGIIFHRINFLTVYWFFLVNTRHHHCNCLNFLEVLVLEFLLSCGTHRVPLATISVFKKTVMKTKNQDARVLIVGSNTSLLPDRTIIISYS